jgi:hypothetical protein
LESLKWSKCETFPFGNLQGIIRDYLDWFVINWLSWLIYSLTGILSSNRFSTTNLESMGMQLIKKNSQKLSCIIVYIHSNWLQLVCSCGNVNLIETVTIKISTLLSREIFQKETIYQNQHWSEKVYFVTYSTDKLWKPRWWP